MRTTTLAAVLFTGILLPGSTLAEATAPRSVDCISAFTVKSSRIVDTQHILFYTGGTDYYLNTLPQACSVLTADRAIVHQTPNGNICRNDIIRVMDKTGGAMVHVGGCGLGGFQSLSEEDARALTAPASGTAVQ